MVVGLCGAAQTAVAQEASATRVREQAPSWSDDDLAFYLHGSMGTEVLPEVVLKSFIRTYPELFPGDDLTVFGLIPDARSDLPVGISRRAVPHLGGLRSVGINCAACHTAQVTRPGTNPAVRVIGVTGHFDADAFFGSIVAGTFQTAEPANMSRFLTNYFAAADPGANEAARQRVQAMIDASRSRISDGIAAFLASERAAASDTLLDIAPRDLAVEAGTVKNSDDLVRVVTAVLRLFHNMRVALHVPHVPPAKLPPRSGPGRNDAFGTLSVALFSEPAIYAPSKYGVAWNLSRRTWVHWDGNARSPIVRNLAASLGLGAPLAGTRGMVDFAAVERHTRLTEQIVPPKYPWAIDRAAAERGRAHFEAHCASCHAQVDEDKRLYGIDMVATDANRARLFTPHQAALYNRFFAELDVPGFKPPSQPTLRSTGKYVAVDLSGVWARSPYLHNGSVRTMLELLTPAAERERRFRRGGHEYDERSMGYMDAGGYVFDTQTDGNTNKGHEYGARELGPAEKRELIEYLKSR